MPQLRHAVLNSFPPLPASLPRRLRRLALPLTALAAALGLAAPAAASAYGNPFAGDSYYVGRTDMGVDVCLTPGDPIRAIGNGVVVGIMPDWYAGQPYLWYQLAGGPQAGQYVYVAEQIDHLARVGQTLQAGEIVARYAKKGTCIETGWSMADGATVAAATTGYKDGQLTTAGASFARFLSTLGVSGHFELTPARSTVSRATVRKRKRTHKQTTTTAPKPVSTPKPVSVPKPVSTPKPVTVPPPVVAPEPGPGPYPGPDFGPGTEPYWPSH